MIALAIFLVFFLNPLVLTFEDVLLTNVRLLSPILRELWEPELWFLFVVVVEAPMLLLLNFLNFDFFFGFKSRVFNDASSHK